MKYLKKIFFFLILYHFNIFSGPIFCNDAEYLYQFWVSNLSILNIFLVREKNEEEKKTKNIFSESFMLTVDFSLVVIVVVVLRIDCGDQNVAKWRKLAAWTYLIILDYKIIH